MANAVRIAVLANASQAKRELDSTTSKANKFKKGLAVAGRVAAAGLLLVGAAAVKAGQAAAEDEAAQSSLTRTLKVAAKATDAQVAANDRYITVAGKSYGVTDDELRPAMARLATATGSVAKAQRLASIAMNVSAGSGKSLESVSTALAKAQATGNVKALSKFGIATKDAKGKTISLAEATQRLADKYKGAASKAAQTTAGKQKILTVQMGELQEQIGAGLLPVMQKLVAIGLKAVEWISNNTSTAKTLGIVLVSLAAAVVTINAVIKVATAVTAAFNAVMALNPVVLVVAAVAALALGLVIAYKKSDRFRAIVDAVGRFGKAAFGSILAKAREVGSWISGNLGPAFGTFKTLVVGYIKLVTLPMRTLLGVIKDIYNWAKDKIPAAFTFMKNKAVAIGNAIAAPFRTVFDLIEKIINKIQGFHLPSWVPGVGKASALGPAVQMSRSERIEVMDGRSGTGGGNRTYNVTVNVPIGASLAEAGREFVRAIAAYEDLAGRRPA